MSSYSFQVTRWVSWISGLISTRAISSPYSLLLRSNRSVMGMAVKSFQTGRSPKHFIDFTR